MIEVTAAILYQVIGELYVARAMTDVKLKEAFVQIGEMSDVISKLRLDAALASNPHIDPVYKERLKNEARLKEATAREVEHGRLDKSDHNNTV